MPAYGEALKRYYPGLLPIEAYVWRAWLRDHEGEFESFLYHVYVGQGSKVPLELATRPDELAKRYVEQFQRATQLKVDAVGFRGSEVWVFEVEDRATLQALGQVLTYGQLIRDQIAGIGTTELAVVCRQVQPDMPAVFEEQGVVLFVVDVPPMPGQVPAGAP